jgi:hypothetical protein
MMGLWDLKHVEERGKPGTVYRQKRIVYQVGNKDKLYWNTRSGNIKIFVFISSTKSEWNISNSDKNYVRYYQKCILRLHVKYRLFLFADFNENCNFWANFRKIIKYQTLWQSAHWQTSCSMRTDRHTYMSELIFAILNFVKGLKRNDSLSLLLPVWLYSLYRDNFRFSCYFSFSWSKYSGH